MARYEAALRTPVIWCAELPTDDGPVEKVEIEFEGRTFVWHHGIVDEAAVGAGFGADQFRCPVLTVIYSTADERREAAHSARRLLSAISHHHRVPISIEFDGGSGFNKHLDHPILLHEGQRPSHVIQTVSALVVVADHRLGLVLALEREARAANSALYEFLAFFNALDAAFDGENGELDSFVNTLLESESLPEEKSGSTTWSHYLRERLRNAVAHAIRHEGRPLLNPDDIDDLTALRNASRHLDRALRVRVSERWPGGVTTKGARSEAKPHIAAPPWGDYSADRSTTTPTP